MLTYSEALFSQDTIFAFGVHGHFHIACHHNNGAVFILVNIYTMSKKLFGTLSI